MGEGEESIYQLTNAVRGKITLNDVPGLVYRANNKVMINKVEKKSIDLNLTSIPKREFIRSLPINEIKKTSIRIESARGCLGRCSFCLNSYKNRIDWNAAKAWRGKSPEHVVKEIEYLYHTFGFRIFNFVDPTFEDPGRKGKERIRQIANLLINKDLKISYKVNMRAETFHDKDDELLKLLKYSGMDVIILGIEGGYR